MCGIAGRVNFSTGAPVDPAVIAAMCDLIAHRGPDGDGVYCRGPVGFGHRRLAIIDLSPAGAQPMRTPDGALIVTFNGEIYNYRDLRAQLAAAGHRFVSDSDTEVVLAAYRAWGHQCLDHFDGMFAFALWDEPNRRLFLARDRLGKKPLHYRRDRDGIAFASEPKAFLAEPTFEPKADLQAVSDYLSLQYVPAPASAFAGVHKLPPAHRLTIEDGVVSIERYWRLSYANQQTISDIDAIEAFAGQLRAAVERRLVSDVPLGAFLSGGIDSGLVVSLMAEATSRVRTFSIGFEEQEYNELEAARLVATQYSTDHTEFVVRPDAVALLPRLVWHFGEPFGDSSALPTYVLAELTRRHVTVALNGDGGDENFAGYERYLAARLAHRFDAVPGPLARLLATSASAVSNRVPSRLVRRAARFAQGLGLAPARRYADWMSHFTDADKLRLLTPEARAAAPGDSLAFIERTFDGSDAPTAVERLLDVDVRTYLPEDLLAKVDLATMAHGLEGRSPFLDHHLMEFAAQLPVRLKLRGRETKYLLRRLAARRLPSPVVNLPKRGFGVPIDHWFRGQLGTYARDVLLGTAARQRGLYRIEFVERMLEEHADGRRRWHYPLWTLLMLESWFQTFIDRRPRAPQPLSGTSLEPAVAKRA